MSRFLVFIVIVLTVIGGIHFYLWARLIRDPQLPAPWGAIATTALLALALSMPVQLLIGRSHPALGRVLVWPAYVWMGTMFLFLVVLAGVDLVRLGAWATRRAGEAASSHATAVDAARRTWLARVAAGVVVAITGGLTGVALRSGLAPVTIRRLRVQLPRLHRAHDGLRIVQLTDVHIGPTIGRAFAEDLVRRTNALDPDIVAITGDLVDGSVATLREAVAPLAGLRARHGVFFVTGNHEYFSGAEQWLAELPRLGIRVLRNERVTIGEGETGFDLAGVDDPSAAHHGGLAPEAAMARALEGRDARRALVVLAHQPKSFLDALPFGVGLQLSGHTHGGQVWPFSYLVSLTQPYLAGLHRRGDAQIYVSCGTGYWGPPMRLGTTAEITQVELQSGPAAVT